MQRYDRGVLMSSPIKVIESFLGEPVQQEQQKWLERSLQALERLNQNFDDSESFTGWFHWPKNDGANLVRQIRQWQENYLIPYDMIVVVGIGGSYAGTRAIDDALRHSFWQFQIDSQSSAKVPIVYAGHNLSESHLIELLELLASKRVVLNVISKSGTTTEPGVAFRILRQYMERTYGVDEARQRILVTTDEKHGALRSLAEQEGYQSFPIPKNVGGRFSVLTAVGLVPLALAGYSIEELMDGAADFFDGVSHCSSEHPVVRLAAVRRAVWELDKKIEILSYGEPKMASFVEWWKQLFGESEGKDGKGLFPVGMIYSTDLHSLGQYLQEGFKSSLQTFLFFDQEPCFDGNDIERILSVPKGSHFKDRLNHLEGRAIKEINKAAMDAAKLAHSQAGVPCLEIHIPKLDLYHLGYMAAFFQSVCAVSATLLELNPYDQPGVEAYKKNLVDIMARGSI